MLNGDADYLPAFLWLVKKKRQILYVSTIFSDKKSQLSYMEYNQIIEHFFEHVVQAAAAEGNENVQLTLDQIAFISSNTKDFCVDNKRLHPDLVNEFTPVNLQYCKVWNHAAHLLGF